MGPFSLWKTKTLRGEKKTLVPGWQERDAGRKTAAKQKFDFKKKTNKKVEGETACIQLDVCLTAQECALTAGPP